MAPATGPRLAAASLIGVVLIALFVYFFVTPVHAPKPNDLPVVVLGPAGAAGALATRLEAQNFKVLRRPDASAARRANDPRGATLNVFVLALVITAILTALVAVQMVPELRLLRPRVVAAGFASLAGGAGALGSALRGVAYFGGAKIVGPLLILAAYVVLGLILNELASRRLPRARLAYS